MECNPEGLSVLGFPILSDYEHEHEQGARHSESVQRRTGSGGRGADLKSELGAVVISDSNNTDPVAPLFKMQSRVIRIAFPQGIFFAGEFLGSRR